MRRVAVKINLQFIFVFTIVCGMDNIVFSANEQRTTLKNPITSDSNDATVPEWFPNALKDIAYYLRAHKFNEYDRRYEPKADLARREYYGGFPRPPLRSLHWEVHKHCEESLLKCVDYLRKRIRNSGLKRGDDTAIVIHEQQWNFDNNSRQIEIVDNDCKKMRDADDIQANPFEGPIERFQWRVTASYYMCWYTMQSNPELAQLSDECDNFANCLDREHGSNNKDHRAKDSVPYSCALYSFCPDPCCPVKHLSRPENCWNMAENPCFEANPKGHRECSLDRSRNTDMRDLILNRWNVTCSCPLQGFEWNSFYGICVDVDECAMGTHTCNRVNEVCLNSPGSFACGCKWGRTLDEKTKKCIPSEALIHLVSLEEEEIESETNKTHLSLFSQFMNLFGSSSTSNKESSLHRFLLIALLLFITIY